MSAGLATGAIGGGASATVSCAGCGGVWSQGVVVPAGQTFTTGWAMSTQVAVVGQAMTGAAVGTGLGAGAAAGMLAALALTVGACPDVTFHVEGPRGVAVAAFLMALT